jgi:Ca2+-binding EF-hand superfamily protein
MKVSSYPLFVSFSHSLFPPTFFYFPLKIKLLPFSLLPFSNSVFLPPVLSLSLDSLHPFPHFSFPRSQDKYFAAGRLKEQQKRFITAVVRCYDSCPLGRSMVQTIWNNFRGSKSSKAGPPVAFVREYYTALNLPDLSLEAPVLAAAGISISSMAMAVENMQKCLLYTRVIIKRDIERTRIRFAFSNESFMPIVANAEFEKADEDGGGTLDIEEIVGLTEDLTRRFKIKALPSDKILECFKRYDADGSGELSKKEFLPFLRDVLKLSLEQYDKAQQEIIERFSAENLAKRTKKIMRVKKSEKEKLLERPEVSKVTEALIFIGAAEPEKRIEDEFSIITDDYSNEFVNENGLDVGKLMDDISDIGDDWEAGERSSLPFEPALFTEVGGDGVFGDIAGFERNYRKKGDDKLEREIEVGVSSGGLKYRRASAWVLPGEESKGDVLRRAKQAQEHQGGKGKGRGKGTK